ncbi:ABC transporter substrate-binding protein [Affinibrenneria salicis]|uniref:ABC transporter substrate-binding protein n=1 Tax=Affinibrenneria salicis TaxID=2590031 RepID=A0A5J5FRM9_9GAMM|nr:extracellular solute-binding protein [Affinibrenneria salicis]KAA8995257.1 ABC transporter substrate-binding protein [Affinibrenneria salicis]
MFQRIAIAVLLCTLHFGLQAEDRQQGFSFALLGEPKYAQGFQHFDYVNPDAPRGGAITLSAIGTYDNFNRYSMRGSPAARTERMYDSLFTASEDEPASYYPLVAESARYPADYRWIEITLNPDASFHDGTPILASDVAFTFTKFMTEGVPQFRLYYKGTTVKAIAPRTVRIELPKPDKDQLLSLFTLPIMPEKFWRQHKLNEPLAFPPPGSGPYRITAYRMGQYVTWSRVKDYWGADLPVNRGRFNFDQIRYDYYLDDNVALEAFKAGAYDFRMESSPKHWATQYQGGNFARGFIVRQDWANQSAQDTRWLAFNIKRPLFADRRVRQALSLLFDFNWMNKALYYQSWQRTDSYFQNTDYAARGEPDAAERAWLTPLADQIPPEVFGPALRPAVSDGSGYNRDHLLQALEMLRQAGWELKNQQLVNRQTGKPFTFELLLLSGSNSQYVLPFQHNLRRLGINMTLREVDSSQFINRVRSRDFDMIPTVYSAFEYPNPDLQIFWSSQYIDSSYNRSGVQDPAIDRLIELIVQHQGQPEALLSLGRALDRVLTWNQFMIPMWYSNHDRFAYWDKFSMPASRPSRSLGVDGWWYDAGKAARLPAARR